MAKNVYKIQVYCTWTSQFSIIEISTSIFEEKKLHLCLLSISRPEHERRMFMNYDTGVLSTVIDDSMYLRTEVRGDFNIHGTKFF